MKDWKLLLTMYRNYRYYAHFATWSGYPSSKPKTIWLVKRVSSRVDTQTRVHTARAENTCVEVMYEPVHKRRQRNYCRRDRINCKRRRKETKEAVRRQTSERERGTLRTTAVYWQRWTTLPTARWMPVFRITARRWNVPRVYGSLHTVFKYLHTKIVWALPVWTGLASRTHRRLTSPFHRTISILSSSFQRE